MFIFKVTEPSSIPYRTPSACAKRAAYPDPPPVIPLPDTGVAQAAYKRLYCPGPLRPEMFSGIGALPEPATGSHVANRGTPVAPCRLKAQRKRATRVGSPCSPVFPNIMSCLSQGQGRCHTSAWLNRVFTIIFYLVSLFASVTCNYSLVEYNTS